MQKGTREKIEKKVGVDKRKKERKKKRKNENERQKEFNENN